MLNLVFISFFPQLALAADHMVQLPVADSIKEFSQQFTFPDFSQAFTLEVLILGATIAIVASLETLL